MFEKISIIIPVYKQETQLEALLADLSPIKDRAEIIIKSEGSRAKSLNAGVASATRPFLWFLHADSRVNELNLKVLATALEEKPDDLHYFGLAFDHDGPVLTIFNAWGANWRSRLFGVPYGDQGFCLSKKQFVKANGYPEDVTYGEDLLFIWHARQAGLHLHRLPSKLLTSARKYNQRGWLRLTLLYQWRWIGMSIPEALKMIRGRI
jgi:hypothetical protein